MNLVPSVVLESVLNITPQWMQEHKLKGLLIDLDNTLAGYGVMQPSAEIGQWLEKMKPYQLIVFSNGKEKRVAEFCRPLDLPYVYKAGKPSPDGVRIVCARYDLRAEEVALVGDQIFTDVLCANRAGIRSVIVKPLVRGFWVDLRRNVLESRYVEQGGNK